MSAKSVVVILILLVTADVTSAQTFVPTGSLNTSRVAYTATLLLDNQVLVVGGRFFNPFVTVLTNAEIYNPVAGTFSYTTGSMATPRSDHAATLLSDGRVLVTGGIVNTSNTPTTAAELYDPVTRTFSATGAMSTARYGHTATLLPNGTVLVTGGIVVSAGTISAATAEVYDPSTGTFSATGAMTARRAYHTATRLFNGTVLVVGGFSGNGAPPYLSVAGADVYNYTTGTFTATGTMSAARHSHTATELPSGSVLMLGGIQRTPAGANVVLNNPELFDPLLNTFSTLGNAMSTPRGSHAAALLADEQHVLIAGGNGASFSYLASAELFDTSTLTFSVTSPMATARVAPTATLLSNGAVLVAGGGNVSQSLASAELYGAPPTLSQLLIQLLNLVDSYNLQQGISNSLDNKLENLQKAIDAANAGDRNSACGLIDSFANEVQAQRGNKLSLAQADALLAVAEQVKVALGCA